MRCISISLKDEYKLQGGELTCLIADCPLDGEHPEWRRPALIAVPGGNYDWCYQHEGEPFATCFLGKGFQTFILKYATSGDGVHYPEQLLELACAVDYVKKHAKELHVNPNEVFVEGNSAGGHLVANLAVDYQYARELRGENLDCRPTAVALSYPVITTKAGYAGSHNSLLVGCTEAEKEQYMQRLELDELVTKNTPPAFIWATAEDQLVPAENAMRFASALARNGVPYELHIYPHGWHGLSVCNAEVCGQEPYLKKNAQWLDNCADFFREYTEERF